MVTIEEVEKYLPLALEQPPTLDTKRNKRNRKITNKKYQIIDNGVRYTLITSLNGDFRSFYSNKKASGEVNSQKAGYASSPKHGITISQTAENANNSEGNDEIRFSVVAPENLVSVASPAESVSEAQKIRDSIALAMDGKADVDLYGNKLSEIFEDWSSADPLTREA